MHIDNCQAFSRSKIGKDLSFPSLCMSDSFKMFSFHQPCPGAPKNASQSK